MVNRPPQSLMTLACGCLLVALSMLPLAGHAAQLEVPLVVETRYVQSVVAAALELDAGGRGEVRADDCNRVDLNDLRVGTHDGALVVSLAVRAVAGAQALGRCRGPAPWLGRMNLQLHPEVAPDGLAVSFAPRGAELVRADGSPGLLSRSSRVLAESLVLPRMQRVRLELAAPLLAIDDLLESALPGQPQALAEPARILAAEVLDDGVSLRVGFRIDGARIAAGPAAEPPLSPAEFVRWQRLEDELDGFLTTVISRLATPAADPELRLEMLGVLLDARHAIAAALVEDLDAAEEGSDGHVPDAEPGRDPVRRIFIESWDGLRPWLAELDFAAAPGLEQELRLAAFIAGGDALRALDALGPEFDLQISRDGLRRLARMLLAGDAPERFTPLPLAVDPGMRELFGLGQPGPGGTGRLWPALLDWFVMPASAQPESPAEALRGLVPRLATLDDYLQLVASLLEQQTGEHLAADPRLPARLKPRLEPLVWATAWKESCWRQFIGPSGNPRVLTSPVGALGMMQINGRVWRGLYDLQRLAEEVDYNVSAGTEILEHYLVDYAIRRGEHKHVGGDDNLIRATYAAYNGGPSHLGRYRRDETPARLRAIDDEFWRHYQTIKADQWPDVSSCYAVGD
jgi:hypothetical protein